jgi:Spy/CpxP family protein refolding chaperone
MWQAERPTALQLVQQFADEHKQMSSATVGGNFDEAQVHAIAGQQAQTIAQLLVEKERLVSKIYSNVLTPEQRTKADQMRARFDTRIEHALKSLESGD